MTRRARPRATCRLQLHAGFTLADARAIIRYLERLGISHLYLSPVLRARAGSTHGYDVADASALSPEIGTNEEWRALSGELHARGMGILLDIVPNHMGIGAENPYWNDVLANGQAAHYARWFDIDWEPPQRDLRGRVLVPVLGDELPAVLEREEIVLDLEGDRIVVRYFEHVFPIDPATAPRLLQVTVSELRSNPEAQRELREVLTHFERMPTRAPLTPEKQVERYRLTELGWTGLSELLARSAETFAAVKNALRAFLRGSAGRTRMLSFLDAQAYRLSHWRRAAREINYRRFFEINELAAVRMEDPAVFGERHRLLLEWIGDGLIDGLRIDHVDGLLEPRAYLARLRDAIAERVPRPADPFPIYVEKILSPGERLPHDWPVDGTTGYEFLNDLESIFPHPAGSSAIEGEYRRMLRLRTPGVDFHDVAYRAKVHILRTALWSDVARLARLLVPLARRTPRTADLRRAELTEGVVQMIAALPVYRTYLSPDDAALSEHDRAVITRARKVALAHGVAPEAVIELIATCFLSHGEPEEPAPRQERLAFVLRFQQTSGPATAKGVEDTALYRYGPLASLNEVGGEPARPLEEAVAALHHANYERARRWPHNLLAVTTHDTKRSADVRARLDVLAEMPQRWMSDISQWRRAARQYRTRVRNRLAPDAATEYLVLQNLLGIWPLPGHEGPAELCGESLKVLRQRIGEYALKATREAKAQTSWTDPNEAWEGALADYLDGIFAAGMDSVILRGVARLAEEITFPGLWNSLARQLVHLTAPGVPDIYQGDELWNFSLVDPDNRRSVDWLLRLALLEEMDGSFALVSGRGAREREMIERAGDGRAKLYLTRTALAERRRRPGLLGEGEYLPLEVSGRHAGHIFAFARRRDGELAITVVPRFSRTLTGGAHPPMGSSLWEDTAVRLPRGTAGTAIRPVLGAGAKLALGDDRTLQVGVLLDTFPVALLVEETS